MITRILLVGFATLLLAIGVMRTPAHADAFAREEEMRRMHFDCDHGDRRACVRFGMILGENQAWHAEWRRTHPEYFWWER
jgi:hypothetical protein